MAMEYLLGIDNGGTYTKAVLFDIKGKEIAHASAQVPLLTPAPQHTERDMEELWQANAEVVRRVMEKSGVAPRLVKGVSFSGHGKGLYLWGRDGRPAWNGIVSTDGRASEYPLRFQDDGTAQKLFSMTCQRVLTCQPVSLLCWFRDNHPQVLENTQWIFGVKDYIRYRMTGVAAAEITDLSGSSLVNLGTASYDPEILRLTGLVMCADKLPPLKYSTEICGFVTEEAAVLTGLAPGTPCAAGMFDIDACAVAMNITDSENLAVIAGTWSINEYISTQPVLDGSVMMNSLYCIPGYYLIEESSPTSAANHEWFINMFLREEKERCMRTGENIYALTDRMAKSVLPDGQNIVFLPYIFGGNYNSRAKASFVGMDSHHTKEQIMRAVFEGVAFCHMTHLEKLLQNREHTRAVRLAGGVCNSAVWVQIFADVFGLPIEIIRTKELGAFGAAMAAGVASGYYESLESAARTMVQVERIVQPIAANIPIYRKKYEQYKKIADALEPYWDGFEQQSQA